MLALLYPLGGLALGAAAGILLRSFSPEAPAVLAAAGCIGQTCRLLFAYAGRPSPETRPFQDRLSMPVVAISLALGLAADLFLLRFPATVIVPAASYLIVRLLLSWQHEAIDRRGLAIAARGGEIITLLASLVAAAP